MNIKLVAVMICDSCLDGAGGVCVTAGCLFWKQNAPDKDLKSESITLQTMSVPDDGLRGYLVVENEKT